MSQFIDLPEIQALRTLTTDGRVLFATRVVRMFAYGFLSVVLALYLAARGLNPTQIGWLLTWTLIGDVVLSLWITLVADRIGRRRMLMVGAGLMIFAGVLLAFPANLFLLWLAMLIGTVSPTGSEVGSFLSIEQAALPQTTKDRQRTAVFAWYNLVGSLATAFGALAAGTLASSLQRNGSPPLQSYQVIVVGYACLGALLMLIFTRLTQHIEPVSRPQADTASTLERRFGLHRSRQIVFKLSALFMLDSFAGGLVIQSVIAYWFFVRYGVEPATLGGIFFGANLLAGLSALAAGRLAEKIGLINTMVWTHIPSNVLLMLVPLMPTLPLAIIVLLARFSISQMDVPTRQSYTMAVVAPDERSAAAGVTTIARTAASAIAPTLTGLLFSASLLSVPFFLAGVLKIVYDLSLYRSFITLKPPEERPSTRQ